MVFRGRRFVLRVLRRHFRPVTYRVEGEPRIIYVDTGMEGEIRYERAGDYGLDDPFKRIALMRLARAMGCLECGPPEEGVQTCRVSICTSRELYDTEAEGVDWVPFDPRRVKPLDEAIRMKLRKAEWEGRLRSGKQ